MERTKKSSNAQPVAHNNYRSAKIHRIRLFDPADARKELAKMVDPDDADVIVGDNNISSRYRAIKAIVDDRRGPMRDLVVGTDAMARKAEEVAQETPNFARPISIIVGAIRVSAVSDLPLILPPICLCGAPGIGKTHFLKRIAEALGIPSRTIPLNLSDDIRGQLVGHSPSWSGPRIGAIAQMLVDLPTASPLFIGDELDKLQETHRNDRPFDTFISLLEPENSLMFRDQFLDFPMRADRANWIFTANDPSLIPTPVLDRLFVFHVPELTEAEKRAVVRRRIDARLAELGVFSAKVDEHILNLLSDLPTRKLLRMIDVAIGMAATQGRKRVLPADFQQAAQISPEIQKFRCGFLP